MLRHTLCQILNVERMSEGILVEFDDNRSFIYSTDLINCMIIYAIEVKDDGIDEASGIRS